MLKSKSFWLSVLISLLFLGGGFALLEYGLVNYGVVFFVLLPLVTGLSVGALPNKDLSMWGLYLTFICLLIALVSFGLEGGVCIVMALCILLPILFIGALLGRYLSKLLKDKGTTDLKLLSAPFLLFLLAAPLENTLVQEKQVVNTSRTEIVLPYSANEVFDAIKSVDTLAVEKSFLMYIGLPVPHKCILEKEAVGAQRTCYFDGGIIKEEVTQLERGKVLRMKVTDYQLTGRKWLGFKDAIYLFEALPNHRTKLTRITTYTTELKPRAYWLPLEEMGIQQEHDYVFRNLQKDLRQKHGQR